MQPDWLIIDGYNLLHQVDECAALLRIDLMTARHRLVRMIENTALRMADKATVVFDGRESGADETLTTNQLDICFSPGNLSADSVIERLVFNHPDPERILVVTSDHAEQATVSSTGAHVMSAQEFIGQCEQDARKSVSKRMRPGEQPRLGDLFPDDW